MSGFWKPSGIQLTMLNQRNNQPKHNLLVSLGKLFKAPVSSLAIGLVLTLMISGCSSLRFPGVYRIDVGQGNILTQEMIDKLRLGMTPRQVEFVMGSPMITDTFHPDRWDYLYNLETGKGLTLRNHLILYFENEKLAKIDNSNYKDPEAIRNNLLEQMGLPVPVKEDAEPSSEQKATSEEAPSTKEAEDSKPTA